MSSQTKITPAEVIERILDLIKAIPEAAQGLPNGHQTRQFWEDLFATNDHTRRILEVMTELPAFTNQAPPPGDAAAWQKLMDRDFAGPAAARPKHANAILLAAYVASKDVVRSQKEVKYWRDRFGPDEKVQRVRPQESNAYLHNPHRGTTVFQRFQGDDTYPSWITSDTHGPLSFQPDAPMRENVKYPARTTLTYCRWPWALLEPQKGKYNWTLVDRALKTAHNRGQTLQTRFQPYTQQVVYAEEPCTARRHPPERSVNVPDWYWDTEAKWIEQGPYAKNEPDSNDPLYLKHFGAFIRAFARRYDGHPDLESVDMAYAGFWGESGGNSTPKTGAALADVYLKAFKKTQLLSMLSTGGSKHAAAKTRGTPRQVGFRADCIGDLRKPLTAPVPPELCWNHTFDAYPKGIVEDGLQDAWMRAPVTMETCGNVATWFMDGYDLDVIVREGYRYHMSVFMPKNVFYPSATWEKLLEFDKKIGYRFVLRQLLLPIECSPRKKITMEFFIDNVGCAPIYRPYALALRFGQGSKSSVVRLKTDIRKWMPGHTWLAEQFAVPSWLKKGEVKIGLCIVDKKNKPKVWFAIDSEQKDGWHHMTSIDVV